MDVLLPPSGTGPGVLIAHPWWGLNDTVRDYGATLAQQGFVVALFDAFNGETTTSIETAETLIRKHWDTTAGRLDAAFAELVAHAAVTHGEVGAVGFSFGGYHLLEALPRELPLERLVTYYATHPLPDTHVPVLAHFAADDDYESVADMAAMSAALASAGPPNGREIYPGTKHWFAETDRPEYDIAAAQFAFARTVAFLKGQ
jgi:carboxymethylenebutenolidase